MHTRRFMILLFAWMGMTVPRTSWAIPPDAKAKTTIWIERFEEPFGKWREGFFYKYTNAENYYYASGGGDPDYHNTGLWLALRGITPLPSHTTMTLDIKPDIGLEAAHLAIDLNSHLQQMTVRFIDKNDKVFAISCVPKTPYYVYVRVAVPISNGLKAIQFDGHGGQVPGNLNTNYIEVIFGPLPEDKTFIIHEMSDGQCIPMNPNMKREKRIKSTSE